MPEWIAADLMAQAEHDLDARAILLTSSRSGWRRAVRQAIERQLPADGPARQALAAQRRHRPDARRRARRSALANRIAPEHLVVRRRGGRRRRSITAGASFVGACTAQAAGDYATGSNHVLPTNGAARFRGGLSAADFVRVIERAAPDARAASRGSRRHRVHARRAPKA